MRLALLAATVLLAASVATATSSVATATSSVAKVDGEKETPETTSKALERAKKGLAAANELIKLYNSDIFDRAKDLAQVLGLFSNVLSFVLAFLSFFGGNSESAELRYMRTQFAEVHAKLTGISLQLEDVKRLIDWNSARSQYSELEQIINARTTRFDLYMRSNTAQQRNTRRRQFLSSFQGNKDSVLMLYNGVVLERNVIASNLAAAAVHYTRNHRKQVMDFLLGLQRLILRGAQMDIAYERIQHGAAAAQVTERDWQARMRTLTLTLKKTHDDVKGRWHSQMRSDVGEFVVNKRGLKNTEFPRQLHRFLVGKYPWRYWFVLNYNDVWGHDKHQCDLLRGGYYQFRAPGNRNLLVASSDPRTSRFSRALADAVLRAVDLAVRTSHARVYTDKMKEVGGRLRDVALRAAVCWGCNVYHWSSGRRIAYRKMTASSNRHMHAYLFG